MTPVDVLARLPHRPPILLLADAWVEAGRAEAGRAEAGRARATLRAPDAFVARGGVWSEPLLVEAVAQTAGCLRPPDSPPGYLVGVRNFTVRRRPGLDEPLEVHVEVVRDLPPLTVLEGRVTTGTDEVASGHVKCFAPAEDVA